MRKNLAVDFFQPFPDGNTLPWISVIPLLPGATGRRRATGVLMV